MPTKHFTSRNVLTLPPVKGRATMYWDCGTGSALGLGILVNPNGSVRSYRVRYHYPGSKKWRAVKLGRVGELDLDEARDKAYAIRGLAAKGLDPRKGDPAKSSDFKSSLQLWTKQEQHAAVSAQKSLTLVLNATRSWHSRPVGTIPYHEIEELLQTKREVAPVMANRLHAHLKTFFRWAKRSHRIPANPMLDMDPPYKGQSRRNKPWYRGTSADAVIKELWAYSDKFGGDGGKFIKALILIGKRKQVTRTMRWEHIKLQDLSAQPGTKGIKSSVWTPPPGSKTKRNHPVPLSLAAKLCLTPRVRLSGRVFVTFNDRLVLTGARETLRKKLNITDFTWHDCRHIAETKCGELRIPPHIRDLMFDHAPQRGAGQGYDHHDYMPEMLEAFEKWGDYVEMVTGRNAQHLKKA